MAAENWKQSLQLVLQFEGGFVNHPKDPGGATNKGITQAVYDAYRKINGKKVQSVKYIDDIEVSDIYKQQYWKRMRGDNLPAGLDYAVFDFAVNSGIARAIRFLQRQIGVEDDGVIGMVTLSKLYDETNTPEKLKAFIIEYCNNRVQFLKSLPIFPTFGEGWLNRVLGYRPKPVLNRQENGVIQIAQQIAKSQVCALPNTCNTAKGYS